MITCEGRKNVDLAKIIAPKVEVLRNKMEMGGWKVNICTIGRYGSINNCTTTCEFQNKNANEGEIDGVEYM